MLSKKSCNNLLNAKEKPLINKRGKVYPFHWYFFIEFQWGNALELYPTQFLDIFFSRFRHLYRSWISEQTEIDRVLFAHFCRIACFSVSRHRCFVWIDIVDLQSFSRKMACFLAEECRAFIFGIGNCCILFLAVYGWINRIEVFCFGCMDFGDSSHISARKA